MDDLCGKSSVKAAAHNIAMTDLKTTALLLLVALCCVISTHHTLIHVQQGVKNRIPETFLSFTYDMSSMIENSKPAAHSPFDDATFNSLISHLLPFVLRVGGTMADGVRLDWLPTDQFTCTYKYTLHQHALDSLFHSARSTNFSIIWALNGQSCRNGTLRSEAFHWEETKHFMQWLGAKSYWSEISALEFGNEPNLYIFNWGRYLSPHQLAADYHNLYKMLDSLPQDIPLFGPDVAFQVPILKEVIPNYIHHFMQAINELHVPLLALTWHWYPLVSDKCPVGYELDESTPQNMIKPSTLHSYAKKQQHYFGSVDLKNSTFSSIMFGEGAGSACQGQHGVDNFFVSSFPFLTSVSELAKIEQGPSTHYFRQSLSAAPGQDISYLLLNYNEDRGEWEATPDFFAAYLWKKLMGRVVLDTGVEHQYVHCDGSRLSVLVVNPSSESISVSLSVSGMSFGSSLVKVYHMEAVGSWSSSGQVQCNGKVLKLVSQQMPAIEGESLGVGSVVSVSGHSYLFAEFSQPLDARCREQM